MKKFFYVRRLMPTGQDRGVVDIPEDDLEQTLKNNPTWINLGEVSINKNWEKPPALVIGVGECPLCGYKAADQFDLNQHKTKEHYS